MNVFFPQNLNSLVFLVLQILFVLITGFFLVNRKRMKFISWVIPVMAVVSGHFIWIDESAGFRMLGLILVLLLAMKILVAQYFSRQFNFKQWLLFSLAWVGMRPNLFFERAHSINYKPLLLKGLLFLSAGIAMFLLLKWWNFYFNNSWQIYSAGIILLISLSWILHFGLLNINAAVLRLTGYPAYPLFDQPLLSGSLQEFWGKRWNLAFTEMTGTIVFKPLVKKINRRFALFLSFMFSGMLHEVALSLSVQKGYGLPMLYFLLQSLLIVAEQKIFKGKQPGPVWVIFWLLIPLPLVFHVYVMREIFLPLITG